MLGNTTRSNNFSFVRFLCMYFVDREDVMWLSDMRVLSFWAGHHGPRVLLRGLCVFGPAV